MSVCPLGDLKKNHVCFFCPGGALALTGTYFLVTFAPHSSPHVTANMVERSLVSWQFLIYFVRLIYHLKLRSASALYQNKSEIFLSADV